MKYLKSFKQFNESFDSDSNIPSVFYHGSPYEFDKFDISKIGTGDEKSKYGWGLYFTDSPKTAIQYAKDLTLKKHGSAGLNIYKVKLIGVRDYYLVWDEPISDQIIDRVYNALIKNHKKDAINFKQENEEYGNWTTESLYEWLEFVLGGKKQASEFLNNKCMISGIIAENAFLHGKIYVAFSDDDIKIISQQKVDEFDKEDSIDESIKFNDNFYKWFGDSKVVDSKGNPLVVYHGTSKKFSKFNIKKSVQPIIWFASNKEYITAGNSGAAGREHIMELYVCIENPAGWVEYEKYGLGQLKGLGYDGAILPDSDDIFNGFVFEPNQLKSVHNKGTWNPDNKNINESIYVKENEYKKAYRFYLLCDELCNLKGVDVKNKMIADAKQVTRREFVNKCAYANSLFEYEGQMKDDPTHGFYSSNINGIPCLYMQYARFEFIFLKNYIGDKEYWLEELYKNNL